MASGRGIVTSNKSFPPLLAGLGKEKAGALIFTEGDAHELAAKSGALLDSPESEQVQLGGELRGIIRRDHEVDTLMATLVRRMGAEK